MSKRLYERPGETCSWGSYMNETGYVQCHSCGGKGIVGQDNWFKVTPETMPPDMEPVIVTVRGNDGGKLTWVDVRYNPEYQEWEQLSDSVGDYWEDEKQIKAIEAVLSKGDRVELIPVKDGVKIIHIKRKEVKKSD